MRKLTHPRSFALFVSLAGALALAIFLMAVLPAQASPPAQQPYPVDTATPTVTFTVTNTPSGSATVTPTVTLGAPVRTGTPTSLVPVTGVDLTNQGGAGSSVGLWIAVWLVGLLLIWFGLRSRMSKRE